MSSTRLLLSAYLACLVFALLQLAYGDRGLVAMERLKAYESQLDANLQALTEKNRQLRLHYEALRTDRDAIRLEARRLGYYSGRDVPLKISGLDSISPVEPGNKILEYSATNEFMDNFFRTIWFVLALFFYAILYFCERFFGWGRTKTERAV